MLSSINLLFDSKLLIVPVGIEIYEAFAALIDEINF